MSIRCHPHIRSWAVDGRADGAIEPSNEIASDLVPFADRAVAVR